MITIERCRDVLRKLDSSLLGTLLGLNRIDLSERMNRDSFSDDERAKLLFIEELLSYLEYMYGPSECIKWIYRSNGNIGSRSPVDILRGKKWDPQGSDPQRVLAVARSLKAVKWTP